MRYSRTEYAKMLVAQRELARAEEDYSRLRAAYVKIAHDEAGHEVALAMVGADMDRAHAMLQSLIGLPRMPFTHDPSKTVRRDAEREQQHEQESA